MLLAMSISSCGKNLMDAMIYERAPRANTFYLLFRKFDADGVRGSFPTVLLRSDSTGRIIYHCWNCTMYGEGRSCSLGFPIPPIPTKLKTITSDTVWIRY